MDISFSELDPDRIMISFNHGSSEINDSGDENNFSEDVENHNYAVIAQRLRNKGKAEVNECYVFHPRNEGMTGLEWAFFHKDWKMAAIFFHFGCDPSHNIFNGTILTMEYFFGFDGADIHPGFDGYNTIPGYEGLELLIDEDNHIGKSYLCLMKILSGENGFHPIHTNLHQLTTNIDLVSDDLHLTGNECKTFLLNSIMCMTIQFGLPNDLALRIAEESLLAKIWYMMGDFGLRGTEDRSNDEDHVNH